MSLRPRWFGLSRRVPASFSLVSVGLALVVGLTAACQEDDTDAPARGDAVGVGAGAGAGGDAAGEAGEAGGPSGQAGEGPSESGASGAGGAGEPGEPGGAGGAAGSSGGAGAAGASSGPGAGAGGSEAEPTDAWGPNACVAADTSGYAVGDTIGALPLRDCVTGEARSLDEVCGASATWIFAAHTHCPTCKATAGFTDEVATAVAAENVAIVHTVHDDNGTSCEQWKKTYGLASYPNVRVYADPDGAVWDKLKSSNYTAPSAFLDGKRVITYKQHGMSKASVLKQIEAARAH
jgi:hypothetical protein